MINISNQGSKHTAPVPSTPAAIVHAPTARMICTLPVRDKRVRWSNSKDLIVPVPPTSMVSTQHNNPTTQQRTHYTAWLYGCFGHRGRTNNPTTRLLATLFLLNCLSSTHRWVAVVENTIDMNCWIVVDECIPRVPHAYALSSVDNKPVVELLDCGPTMRVHSSNQGIGEKPSDHGLQS